ncbi:MAG: DNA mismatch endonuclease Vsr [Acidobacteriales bacterium]|nr:DNA mismatch endonuclease Vsr [Terriglobales bacterium]
MDNISKAQRRANMRAVRSRDTGPEMLVRSLLHRLGYRFRLHRKDLPGTPDLVFISRRKVIFVHGCFWHQHPKCPRATVPSSNVEFWGRKLERNTARDRGDLMRLRRLGWKVMVVWECNTKRPERLTARLRRFLANPPYPL